jgi:flagellar capping protein FliD
MAESLEELSTKFDDMAKQLESFSDMVTQFSGLREMMRQMLDSINGMGHR